MPYLIDQSFNDMLTNDIVCFEQLGPNIFSILLWNMNNLKSINKEKKRYFPKIFSPQNPVYCRNCLSQTRF